METIDTFEYSEKEFVYDFKGFSNIQDLELIFDEDGSIYFDSSLGYWEVLVKSNQIKDNEIISFINDNGLILTLNDEGKMIFLELLILYETEKNI
jgi:hypothetical protein